MNTEVTKMTQMQITKTANDGSIKGTFKVTKTSSKPFREICKELGIRCF